MELAYVEHYDTWKHEKRRTGAALIAGAGLAAVGWYDASQTFVVVTPQNTLTHPSFLNWILIPLGFIALAGLYCYAATFWPPPLLGRVEAKEKDRRRMYQDIQDALLLETLEPQTLDTVHGINLALNFTNAKQATIEFPLDSFVIVPEGGKTIDGKKVFTFGRQVVGRLLPGKPYKVTSGSIVYGSLPFPWKGSLEFTARYGLTDRPLFQQHRKITYSWNGKAVSINDEINTDEVI